MLLNQLLGVGLRHVETVVFNILFDKEDYSSPCRFKVEKEDVCLII